jgi:hypothetical protein
MGSRFSELATDCAEPHRLAAPDAPRAVNTPSGRLQPV